MGTFNDKISAEYHPPRKWVLERALSYTNTDLEVDALKEIGVDFGQGYFIARPVPVEKVQSTLKIIYQKKPFIQQHTSAS